MFVARFPQSSCTKSDVTGTLELHPAAVRRHTLTPCFRGSAIHSGPSPGIMSCFVASAPSITALLSLVESPVAGAQPQSVLGSSRSPLFAHRWLLASAGHPKV